MANKEIRQFKKSSGCKQREIAIRVFRALNELGIGTVAIFSKEDKYALFRTKADEAYLLDEEKGPVDAYLDIDGIIRIAKIIRWMRFIRVMDFYQKIRTSQRHVKKSGITFIGPSADMMRAMGDKISSKKMAMAADVPTIPGIDKAVENFDEVQEAADFIGYPVMLKASNGGGGRGMRIVNSKDELEKSLQRSQRRIQKKLFGDEQIFIEKYLRSPKHIEVQVIADKYGNAVHLYDRDCSVQRRHQKVVEYAPAFTVPEAVRQQIFESSIRLVKKVGYRNAGTLEFLVDDQNHPYFIEMNPRIQVEHTVSEMITGIDIVQSQIMVAEGYPLDSEEIGIPNQDAIQVNGYSIQTRITTEDPAK